MRRGAKSQILGAGSQDDARLLRRTLGRGHPPTRESFGRGMPTCEISNTLSTVPDRFAPLHRRKPNGDLDPRPWCQGFHAAMRLRIPARASLPCCCPSCYIVAMIGAVRCSDRNEAAARAGTFRYPSSRRGDAPTLDADATQTPADHRRCGSSYRLRSTRRHEPNTASALEINEPI
jgi:hypothetical protein